MCSINRVRAERLEDYQLVRVRTDPFFLGKAVGTSCPRGCRRDCIFADEDLLDGGAIIRTLFRYE
jgi:hypothetical protein